MDAITQKHVSGIKGSLFVVATINYLWLFYKECEGVLKWIILDDFIENIF